MDDVVKTSSTLASKNENELVLEYNADIDFVTADQTRLKQVVLNLISNACKFTEKGIVTVSIDKINQEGGDLISIDVSDNLRPVSTQSAIRPSLVRQAKSKYSESSETSPDFSSNPSSGSIPKRQRTYSSSSSSTSSRWIIYWNNNSDHTKKS